MARAHFGAMLEVAVSENLDDDPTAVAVLPFNKIPSPREGRGVFGLLPIVGQPQAVLYGVAPPEDLQQPVTLVQGAPKKLPDGAARLADDLALLDGAIDAPSGLVRLGIFEAPLIMGEAK